MVYQPAVGSSRLPQLAEEPDLDSGAAVPQPFSEAECRNMQAEVASKVSIARGADTADLELGIIGYVIAQTGTSRIGYCEGGGAETERGIPIRIGDCIQTGPRGRMRIRMNDQDDKNNFGSSYINLGTESTICLNGFTVHRDDGQPGWIDLLRGAIRVITKGWSQNNGFGVHTKVKAAVIIGSEVILNYDPDRDVLESYVIDGSMEVSDTSTGETQVLTAGENLTSEGSSLGEVQKLSQSSWDLQLLELGLENEAGEISPDASFSDLEDRFQLPTWAIVLAISLCGGGILLMLIIGGVILGPRACSGGGERQ